MAHTDACKIQVTQLVEKLVEKGFSVNKACKETEQQSDGIPAKTIERWWYEIARKTNDEFLKNEEVESTIENDSGKQENQDLEPSHGGKRKGSGRKGKYVEEEQPVCECTEAMQFAVIAISQLSRIRADDPQKQSALDRVVEWIEQFR